MRVLNLQDVRKFMKNLVVLDWICWVLVIIGALNWGLIGFLNFNLVGAIFGAGMIARIIYALVGLAAIYMIVMKVKNKTV